MGEIAILHAADSRAFSCRLSSELAAEGHSVLRREAEQSPGATDPATKAHAVVVVWSQAMLKNAPMIEAARRALARRALAPVRIGGVEPPSSFAHLWPIDLDGWNGETDDPRWQFVRDEIALAMRRSEIALSTSQIIRPPALRRLGPRPVLPSWRRAGAALSGRPLRLIAPLAAGLAVIATAAVIISAQEPAVMRDAPPMVAYVEPAWPGDIAERPMEVPAPPLRGADSPLDAAPASAAFAEAVSEAPAGDAFEEVSNSAPFLDENGSPAPVLAAGGPEALLADAPALALDAGAETAEPLVLASLSAAVATLAPAPAPPRDDYAGLIFRDCYDCPDMTAIPGAGIALSRREVTFDQWAACVRDKACRPAADDGLGRGSRPVVNISHEDARAYAEWLSRRTGWAYRLPTEIEWARAAQAEQSGVSPSDANYAAAPWKAPVRVGSFKASAYGLFDMRGNVWEWTADCAREEGGVCAARVLKGGAYDSSAAELAADARWLRGETARAPNIGLRVARESP